MPVSSQITNQRLIFVANIFKLSHAGFILDVLDGKIQVILRVTRIITDSWKIFNLKAFVNYLYIHMYISI